MESTNNNKKTIRKKTVTLLGFSLLFLVLDRQWGFIYSHTVFSSRVATYVVFITLLILFLQVGNKYDYGKWTNLSVWWAPYLFYTILGYFSRLILQNLTYWLCCLILILIAACCFLLRELPLKALFWSGIVALVGVFFQLLFPAFYSAYIGSLFIRDDLISLWTEGGGLNGFTYQLGTTASIIICAELVLVCMKEKVLPAVQKHSYLYFLILILMILGVFLTGKRTISVIALILPVLLTSMSERNTKRKALFLFLVGVAGFVGVQYFISNVVQLEETRFISRFATSYVEMQGGDDFSSGRSNLSSLAINAYESNPIFGIGVGRFIEYTGAKMDVHNTYLQVLCEQGIVGFVFYVLPLSVSLFYTRNLYKRTFGDKKRYVLLSLAFQIMFILLAFTSNCNLGIDLIIYFIAIAISINVGVHRTVSSYR